MNGLMLAKDEFNVANFQKQAQNMDLLDLLGVIREAKVPIGFHGTRRGREVAAFQVFYNRSLDSGLGLGTNRVQVTGELDHETADAVRRVKEKVGTAKPKEKGKKEEVDIVLDTSTLDLLVKLVKSFLDPTKGGSERDRITAVNTIERLREKILVTQAIIDMNENSAKSKEEKERWNKLKIRSGEIQVMAASTPKENDLKKLLEEANKMLDTAIGLSFLSGFEKIADDPNSYLGNLSRGKLENIRDTIQKAAENETDRKGTIYLKFRTVILIIEQVLSETKV